MKMKTEKIYLAIPYSIDVERSFKTVNEVAAKLMNQGYILYSPITQSHPISTAHDMPKTWDYWGTFDTEFIKWCDTVLVVDFRDKNGISLIPQSIGCMDEMKIGRELGKTIKFYNLDTDQIEEYCIYPCF